MYTNNYYSDEEINDSNKEEYVHRGNGWDYAANRSVNAVNAEKEGKFVLADWGKKTKAEILQRIMDKIALLGGPQAVGFDISLLKKAQKAALLNLFLDNFGEYHHVKVRKERGYFREELYFYEISTDKLKKTTDSAIESAIFVVSANNSIKRKKQLENQVHKLTVARIAAERPLIIGIFSKRNYYYNKWQSSFTTFIGVIDGSHLYYYDLPKKADQEPVAYTKEQLKAYKIRKTAWPYVESSKIKDLHMFKTFAAFVKKYPEYGYKRTEIRLLKAFRKTERTKLK